MKKLHLTKLKKEIALTVLKSENIPDPLPLLRKLNVVLDECLGAPEPPKKREFLATTNGVKKTSIVRSKGESEQADAVKASL